MSSSFPTFIKAYDARHKVIPALILAIKWRGTRFTFKYVVIPIAAIAIVYICFGVYWKHQLNDKFAEIRAKGEPATASDLAMKPIPDSENAAVIYQKAFDELKSKTAQIMREESTRYTYFPLNSASQLLQMKSDPEVWLKNHQEGKGGYTDDPAYILSDARKNILRFSKVLELARQASLKPKCEYPCKWSDGLNASFDHLMSVRQICGLLITRAVVESMDGHMDSALSDIHLSLRVASSIENNPTMLSFNRYLSCIGVTMDGLCAISQEHDLSSSQARRIYDDLASIPVESLFQKAVVSQRAIDCSWFDKARRNGSEIICFFQEEPPSNQYACIAYTWYPYSFKDEQKYFLAWDRIIPLTKLPYREISRRFPDQWKPPVDVGFAPLTRVILNHPDYMASSRDGLSTFIGLTQTAMALKVYKSEHGEYPESLSKLTWKIPDDVFSGKPFIYMKIGDGFKLYSVGVNLKDDGGKTLEYVKWSKDSNAFDIVWMCKN